MRRRTRFGLSENRTTAPARYRREHKSTLSRVAVATGGAALWSDRRRRCTVL